MATILFYEKPGCINNEKQKKLLRASGHTVEEVDILNVAINADELLLFFGEMSVWKWFNRAAPSVKSGDVVPENISADQAIPMMLADRLLIRRPLMIIDGKRYCGFDIPVIDRTIGLCASPGEESTVINLRKDDLSTCPRISTTSCDAKGE